MTGLALRPFYTQSPMHFHLWMTYNVSHSFISVYRHNLLNSLFLKKIMQRKFLSPIGHCMCNPSNLSNNQVRVINTRIPSWLYWEVSDIV